MLVAVRFRRLCHFRDSWTGVCCFNYLKCAMIEIQSFHRYYLKVRDLHRTNDDNDENDENDEDEEDDEDDDDDEDTDFLTMANAFKLVTFKLSSTAIANSSLWKVLRLGLLYLCKRILLPVFIYNKKKKEKD
uniref:Centromere protein CENP-B C-terminal domain-containing protein n=1 Tax=Vespula pensylvanica TaxID=30213 RepID=A0A834JNS1_VESPE|nr:hypothetical protein H0235_017669 [Vespula pensylvanica]